MQKYLFITVESKGSVYKEIHAIGAAELEAIRPVIDALLNTTDEEIAEYSAYSLYGHLDGFEVFSKYAPEGENGAYDITDIKLLELKEIML